MLGIKRPSKVVSDGSEDGMNGNGNGHVGNGNAKILKVDIHANGTNGTHATNGFANGTKSGVHGHIDLCSNGGKGNVELGYDPLNWGRVAAGLSGSHLEEVKRMVHTFFECEQVMLEGASLTVADVTAIARRPDVKVALNAEVAKSRVDESSNWVLSNAMKGTDTYGVTTGKYCLLSICCIRASNCTMLQAHTLALVNFWCDQQELHPLIAPNWSYAHSVHRLLFLRTKCPHQRE